MGLSLVTLLLLGSFFSALVGFILGRFVGKGGSGFVLGLILGPIGWIIVLLLPRDGSSHVSNTADEITYPQNPSISFEEYKKQQKITRPGFSHKTTKEQVSEWTEYVNALEAQEKKRVNLEPSPPPKDAVVDGSQNEPRGSVAQRLKELQDLLEKGLITEEEAVSTKARILDDL